MILALLAAAGVPAADKTPAAARAVVVRYYDAIEHKRYRAAWLCWDRDGTASGQSYAAFARGFARTRHVRVAAGRPTDGEGAAGSLFVTVPVVVTATLTDGTLQRFQGSYMLRRVNDVPGASATQLRWHLHAARLRGPGQNRPNAATSIAVSSMPNIRPSLIR